MASQRSTVLGSTWFRCSVLDNRGNHLATHSARLRLGRFEKSRKIHNRPPGARPMILPGDVVSGHCGAYMLTLSIVSRDPTLASFRMES